MRPVLFGSSLGLALVLALACGSGEETTAPPPPPPPPADATVADPPVPRADAEPTAATPVATAPADEGDPMGLTGDGPACCSERLDDWGVIQYYATDGACTAPQTLHQGAECETVCCDFGYEDNPSYKFALSGMCKNFGQGPFTHGKKVDDRDKCTPKGTKEAAAPVPAPAPEPSPKTPMGRPGSESSSSSGSGSSSTGTKPSASGKRMTRPK